MSNHTHESTGINWVDQTIIVDDGFKSMRILIHDDHLEKLFLAMLARKYPAVAHGVANEVLT
jgi:hypothetical protein